ncbi:protein-(glutamine-N5) methyltransferase, release factor-specific [Pseudoscardovia radai]|uniref:Release factor glutamine methyltransferase n=1 Tax=Pseudoscardovia radai TaxID=987066 RepID=A0A261EWK6_9BIFI|nr:peptide chain release factor N(5)-glutamine methyltransferase [Pseudoscardovia radai]OZG51250.1 protein-(glutamine-N5) methyltransferase, release factor-specific [Pseudoscardovia radai]
MTDDRFDAPSDASDVRLAVIAAGAALEHAGVEHGEYEAVLLLAWAAGCEPGDVRRAMLMGETMDVFLSHFAGMPRSVLARFDDALRRRCAREPLQYIVGTAPFRYLSLDVGPGVFVPRPETEMAVDLALDWLRSACIPGAGTRIVDLCAGTGAIGLSLVTELPASQVWAVEKDDDAIVWTRRNASRVLDGIAGAADRYHLVQADATDAATLAQLDGTVDAVVTNPPYIPLATPPEQPEVIDWDPHVALFGGSDDGLHIPVLLLRRIRTLLRPGGLVVMEHDITQGAALREAALRMGFVRPRTEPDLTGRDRFLVACRDGE